MEVITPAERGVPIGYDAITNVKDVSLDMFATTLEYIADPPVVIIMPSPDEKSRLNDASGQVNVGEA